MEHRARDELLHLVRDALKIGGAPIEMRLRRFVSFVRPTDPELADALGPLVQPARALRRSDMAPAPSPVDDDSRLQLLRVRDPLSATARPVLAERAHAAIERLIEERNAIERLATEGLAPSRSLLLSGPPGIGKTMTAAWIAHRLELPLLTLDLASVMSSFLGRTGANVRAVLDHAQSEPCVLLLDEFDAIAKRRNDETEIGELKRLVTVLLQAIDDWTATSLLIAATNHAELLDPAVWRRFDVCLELELPTEAERRELLAQQGIEPYLASLLAGVTQGQSHASLTRAAVAARKSRVLAGSDVSASMLDWAASAARGQDFAQHPTLRDIQILAHHYHGNSARQIAEQLGVSHTTVNRTLRQLKGEVDARTESAHR